MTDPTEPGLSPLGLNRGPAHVDGSSGQAGRLEVTHGRVRNLRQQL